MKIDCLECKGAGRDYNFAICEVCNGEGRVVIDAGVFETDIDAIRATSDAKVPDPTGLFECLACQTWVLADQPRCDIDICPFDPAPESVVFGGYVNHPPYKEMRLRMLLTGTNAPDDATWSAALSRLLTHLDVFPLDATYDISTCSCCDRPLPNHEKIA